MSSTRPPVFLWNSPMSTKQGVQPKNWKMLNKLSHWNHFCSGRWKILPVLVPNLKKNHILLDRGLSDNFTIKANGNIILSCAVSILQVSHTVCRNTTYGTLFGCLVLLTVSMLSWFLFQEKHILTLIRCFLWSLLLRSRSLSQMAFMSAQFSLQFRVSESQHSTGFTKFNYITNARACL